MVLMSALVTSSDQSAGFTFYTGSMLRYPCSFFWNTDYPMLFRTLAFLGLLLAVPALQAKQGTYQTPEAFLDQTFAGTVPKPGVIWLTGEVGETAARLLEHKPDTRRIRYWQQGNTSAWVLNEIGKHKPITIGIEILNGRIKSLKVLVFRESRGWEVKTPAFTQQFTSANLTDSYQLDRSIDGITGATLSVRALKRAARLALYLNSQINSHDSP